MRRDLGDFQTPRDLAAAVLRALGSIGSRWTRVLEPTCGSGSFLHALLEAPAPPRELIGVEVQESHWSAARSLVGQSAGTRVEVVQASLFDLDLRTDLRWHDRGPLLVVGNPPWVTSAALGRMASRNVPTKSNVKALPGLAALTGSANFDIAEAVWLKLLAELAEEQPTIALLCKTSVARAVLEFAHHRALPIADAAIFQIDAPRWFGAAVGACLLRVTMGPGRRFEEIPVFGRLEAASPLTSMGFRQGKLIADAAALDRHSFALGTSPLNWRQGLKHDAAAIMELSVVGAGTSACYRNRLGQDVDIEPEFVYPLLKGADLRKPPRERPCRAVILTQQRIGQETSTLEHRAPRLWSYLHGHRSRFMGRKSSIYRAQPEFALFGVGPYSFAPWKVAVSGLHRPARFQAIGPADGRPVMFDDTCYLLPCQSASEAAVLSALCNSSITLGVVHAMSFPDAKRPVTKGLLQRIDLSAILDRVDCTELAARARTVLAEQPASALDEVDTIPQEIDRLRRKSHDVVTRGRDLP